MGRAWKTKVLTEQREKLCGGDPRAAVEGMGGSSMSTRKNLDWVAEEGHAVLGPATIGDAAIGDMLTGFTEGMRGLVASDGIDVAKDALSWEGR